MTLHSAHLEATRRLGRSRLTGRSRRSRRSRPTGRLAAVLLAAVLAALPVFAGRSLADVTDFQPPSETVVTPDTEACPQQTGPAAADDTSESVPSGSATPKPLPVPEPVVGGDRLAACGPAVPRGTADLPPDITAAAWLIADLDSGDVLAAKDPHGRYRPASTLKLLTMNVLLRTLKDLDQVVVGADDDPAQDGTKVGIGPGGKYTVRQLMLFLMMGSGNDVANALARANGGTEKTLEQMNSRARALGALDTRAATVSGLDGPGQMTSAYDLALIARSNMTLEPFPELIATQYSEVPGYGAYQGFGIANDNQLLFNYPGALGGKTGFTDAAGNTFVGMAERDGRRLVVTMLAGTQQPREQWMQAASLLDWGFALPDGTTPMGRLVSSGAEATAAAPTVSMPPAPTRPTHTLGGSAASPTPVSSSPTAASPTGSAPVGQAGSDGNDAAAGSGSGSGWTVLIWIGIALVAVLAVIAVAAGLRGSGPRPRPGTGTGADSGD